MGELVKFLKEDIIKADKILHKVGKILSDETLKEFKTVDRFTYASNSILMSLFEVFLKTQIDNYVRFSKEENQGEVSQFHIDFVNQLVDDQINEYKNSVSRIKDYIKKQVNKDQEN